VVHYINATGLMWENAKEFGAMLLWAEHRRAPWRLGWLAPPLLYPFNASIEAYFCAPTLSTPTDVF
jgi:hypothetical protein